MTGDELEAEARYRLELYFEVEGIDDPSEVFSERELREMLRAERQTLIERERRYD